ncbi:hypothetical protein M422DRAFT_249202 [Sphaerobolus stellatus SS14]|nr:hypothetical protein M422DRAFT_249202 [Sphaerobolus stellatus SS14]
MVPFFLILSYLTAAAVGASSASRTSNACSCTSGFIGVDVDVKIAVDPSDGKPLNSTTLRRQKQTFQIFGQLCQPVNGPLNLPAPVQVLIHGQTYTSQAYLHSSMIISAQA